MGRRVVRKKTKSRKITPRPAEGPLPASLLALDVSSVCVGWAVFHRDELVEYGKIDLHTLDDHGERLAYFRRHLCELLTENDPEAVVVEMPFHGRQRFAFGTLMMYIGVVFALHFEHFGRELPKEGRLPASYIKRVMDVPHKETHAERKEQMVRHINALYGLRLKYRSTKAKSDDDMADAIACGHVYLARWAHV